MGSTIDPPRRDALARLRFAIIGPLLAAPLGAGELRSALRALAGKPWRHPDCGREVRFGVSTLERWYYAARRAPDPVAALRNRLRGTLGRFKSLTPEAIALLGTSDAPTKDEVRRVYMRLVRLHRPERDPDGFQRAREST